MEKVKEPYYDEPNECPRCNQNLCSNCIDFKEVDFEVLDTPESVDASEQQWKGERVCPWCYNQLIDLREKKGAKQPK